jgi:hypothetical protein
MMKMVVSAILEIGIMPPPMTDRRRRFMELILADPGNCATKAAREAGYAWPNKQGPRLMATAGFGDVIRIEIARQLEEYRRHLQRERERKAGGACW